MDQLTGVCADGEGHKAALQIGSVWPTGHCEKPGTDFMERIWRPVALCYAQGCDPTSVRLPKA